MAETLEQQREELSARADRLPGVAEMMAVYGQSVRITQRYAYAENIVATVASAANPR